MAMDKSRYDASGRKVRESRTATRDQIVGQDLGKRRRKSFTPEYREWLLRQEAKSRHKRV